MNRKEIIDVARDVLDLESRAVGDLARRLGDEFVRAVNLLCGTRTRVIVVGMGMYSGIPEIIKAGKGKVYTWALLPEEVGMATGNVCIKIAKKQTADIKKITATPLIWVGKENIDENWKYKLD